MTLQPAGTEFYMVKMLFNYLISFQNKNLYKENFLDVKCSTSKIKEIMNKIYTTIG